MKRLERQTEVNDMQANGLHFILQVMRNQGQVLGRAETGGDCPLDSSDDHFLTSLVFHLPGMALHLLFFKSNPTCL